MGKINLVIGAGFSGAVIANLLANSGLTAGGGERVVLIDRKDHIAGNSFDYRDENGIMVHKYGSHIFHTQNEKVWNFLNGFCTFNTYMHEVRAIADGIEAKTQYLLCKSVA